MVLFPQLGRLLIVYRGKYIKPRREGVELEHFGIRPPKARRGARRMTSKGQMGAVGSVSASAARSQVVMAFVSLGGGVVGSRS